MAYASWSVVFGEQPSAAKWNILGTNDASFNDGTGIGAGVITVAKRSGGFKTGTFAVTTTGSLAITGVGFTPKQLLFTFLPSTSTARVVSASGATDGTTQFATGMAQAGSTGATGSFTNRCLYYTNTSGTAQLVASITSMDADGFTVNVNTYGGAYGGDVAYVALA